MPAIKLKNEKGEWVAYPFIKGDKGEQGIQGEIGPDGKQGPPGPKGDPTTINNKAADANGNIQLAASDVGAIGTEERGVAGGVATLNATGKVPKTQIELSAADIEALSTNGGNVNGAINMTSNDITNIASISAATGNFSTGLTVAVAPVGDTDVANKAYVDSKAGGSAATSVSATLSVAGWSGTGPYTQTITVTGMTTTRNGIAGIAQTATTAERDAARVSKLAITSQAVDQITITADGDKPTIDIPIVVTLL